MKAENMDDTMDDTMTQTCLNSVTLCYVQKHKLDLLDRKMTAEQLICHNEQNTFVKPL